MKDSRSRGIEVVFLSNAKLSILVKKKKKKIMNDILNVMKE